MKSFFSRIFTSTPVETQDHDQESQTLPESQESQTQPSQNSPLPSQIPASSPPFLMAPSTAVAETSTSSQQLLASSTGKARTRKTRERMQVERERRHASRTPFSPGASQLQREAEESVLVVGDKGHQNALTQEEGTVDTPALVVMAGVKTSTKRKAAPVDDQMEEPSSQGIRASKRLRKGSATPEPVQATVPQTVTKRSKRLEALEEIREPVEEVPKPDSRPKPQGRNRTKNKAAKEADPVLSLTTPAPASGKKRSKKQKMYGKSPARARTQLDQTREEAGIDAEVAQESAIDEAEDVPKDNTIPRAATSSRKRRRSSGSKAKRVRMRKNARSKPSSDAIPPPESQDKPVINGHVEDKEDLVNGQRNTEEIAQINHTNNNETARRTLSPSPTPLLETTPPTTVRAAVRLSSTKKSNIRERDESSDGASEQVSSKSPKKAKKKQKVQAKEPESREKEQPSIVKKKMKKNKSMELPPLLEGDLPTSGIFTATEIGRLELAVRIFKDEHDFSDLAFNELVQNKNRHDSNVGQLWTALCDALPHRKRKAVQTASRRRYHNFEERGKFTEVDDEALKQLMVTHPSKWVYIGSVLGRLPTDCRDRWRNYLACGDNRVTDVWTQGEEIELERAVYECRDAIFEEARRKAVEDNEGFVRPDWQKLINWNAISEKMGFRRSRLQCYQHYKTKEKRAASRPGSLAGTPGVRQRSTGSPTKRTVIALANYDKMLVGDKVEILQQILETDTFDEEFIPWSIIAQTASNRPWTTRDRKIALEKMKTLITPREDMSETIKALIKHFKKQHPDELEDFYDDADAQLPKKSTPHGRARRKSMRKTKSTKASDARKNHRSAEFVEESEDDGRAHDLSGDSISSENSANADNAAHEPDIEPAEDDDIESVASVEDGRHASHDTRLSAVANGHHSDNDDIEDSEKEPTKTNSSRSRHTTHSLSLVRNEATEPDEELSAAGADLESNSDNDDQVDDTFQGHRPLQSDDHVFRSSPAVENTPEPNDYIVDLENASDEELEDGVKSEPDSEFAMDHDAGEDTCTAPRAYTVDLDGDDEQLDEVMDDEASSNGRATTVDLDEQMSVDE